MTDNYYEKLKEMEKKETPVIEAEVVGDELKTQDQSSDINDQAKEFFKSMFEGQAEQNPEQMEQIKKAQYAMQIKFVLKRRFASLSLLFGIFGLTSMVIAIMAIFGDLSNDLMIETLELIKWEITDDNIALVRNAYYLLFGIQALLGAAMLLCAYYAKIGHNNALKYGKIVVLVSIIFTALSFEIFNLLILTLIYMNIRSTKSFIDNNIGNFQ